jgi:CRP-like cAMP-binding protein
LDLSQQTLERQAFPVLDAEQIGLLRPLGRERATRAGDVLFAVGDADYPLVVVLAGRTEIVDRSEGVDRAIKVSGPGEFHGELGLLTGQAVFLDCVVREPGSVLLVPPAGVADAIRTIPALGDVLVTAFAARRQILMRSAASTGQLGRAGGDVPDRLRAPDPPRLPRRRPCPEHVALPGHAAGARAERPDPPRHPTARAAGRRPAGEHRRRRTVRRGGDPNTGRLRDDRRRPLHRLADRRAVGDARRGSVKRVASAVGEGSVVVQAIHRHLETARPVTAP